MNLRILRTTLFALIITATVTFAQEDIPLPQGFEGSDDFNDGFTPIGAGERWIREYSESGTGSPTESEGRLIYDSLDEDIATLDWTDPTVNDFSWDDSWVIETTVSNDSFLGEEYSDGDEAWGGITVFNWNDGDEEFNNFFGLYLGRNSDGGFVEMWAGYQDGDNWISSQTDVLSIDFTIDIQLALLWDADDSMLLGLYAPAGESGFITIGTLDPFGEDAGLDDYLYNSFGVQLEIGVFGDENAVISFDSFSAVNLSSVPEPSTSVALAGICMLGMAIGRRRRAASASKPAGPLNR